MTDNNHYQRVQRRVVSSNLSSNYAKFSRSHLLLVALILAIVGLGTVVLGLALGWRP